MRLTASLVLYRNAPEDFEEAIRCVLEAEGDAVLSVVDNSPAPLASRWFDHPRLVYQHPGENLGFGAGHNLAFQVVAACSDVHFIVNPDVSFEPEVLARLADVLSYDDEIVAAMPEVRDQEAQVQNLCKALPSPTQLIVRRFLPFATLREAIDRSYEFRTLPRDRLSDIPNLSGCFLTVRSSTFERIGGFDQGFFMYMEDIDLVRRLGDLGRTVFVPDVQIRHGHARSSYRFGRLMLVHVRSAVRYFNKWGWLLDPVRRQRNAAARRALNRS